MIKLENVSYVYMQGGPFEKTALNNINLEIGDGEFIGLIGHTGSGKSTLIQLLNGLIKPTEGRVRVAGFDLTDKKTKMRDVRFKVGLVMQYPEHQLFEETVFKDIAFGPQNMGLPQEEIKNRVEFAANLVGLSKEILDKSPFDLSGGQKRRVAIAGVLAMEPKVLILDEPTAGLDPGGRDEILFKIKDMHERMNLTVILVSHSMEDVAKLADRILVMNSGSIEMFDTPSKIFENAERLSQIGLNVPQITQVCDRLRAAGMPLAGGIYTIEDAAWQISKLLKGGSAE
ncbi:MAG: energy-coupling factor transporter ATPase [Eubacteriales bacterium]|nr:energy-coupling factor transporter ATPase [Eubacteriales bacterium]MDO5586277.1 energy-coupling factor transporter ATPase [Clostridia bacterium]MDY4212605.1 energy-coupling factor transporter ATPase [Eubacteriales bacterium]MDY5230072.1 energy-coupling factor transporter ATPase [Eubacteriales bacterium]